MRSFGVAGEFDLQVCGLHFVSLFSMSIESRLCFRCGWRKPVQRVRVGPFANRAAAEAARLRIKQVKPAVPGSVVELAGDAKADAPASALPAHRAGGWAVQLGALKAPEDANKLRDRLKNAGFAAFVDKVDANGTTLWRVRAGPEVDRGAADKMRASIKDKLKLDGIIVTL